MVYDCFMFFNEIELLKVRLEYLYDYVDYFVITECNITQSGQQKPLYFKENEQQFDKWKDKIIYNLVNDVPRLFSERYAHDPIKSKILDICARYSHYPHTVWRYDNETYQKECTLKKLYEINCKPDDIIMFSDLDEIPNRELIGCGVRKDTHINFAQSARQYYCNVIKDETWYGTMMFYYSYISEFDKGLNGLRMAKTSQGITIPNGGWHFSFLGGPDAVKQKIIAYGHQEFNTQTILDSVETNIKNNADIFYRNGHTYRDAVNFELPNELTEIFKKYPNFIKD